MSPHTGLPHACGCLLGMQDMVIMIKHGMSASWHVADNPLLLFLRCSKEHWMQGRSWWLQRSWRDCSLRCTRVPASRTTKPGCTQMQPSHIKCRAPPATSATVLCQVNVHLSLASPVRREQHVRWQRNCSSHRQSSSICRLVAGSVLSRGRATGGRHACTINI
jgi:hypothetical protein